MLKKKEKQIFLIALASSVIFAIILGIILGLTAQPPVRESIKPLQTSKEISLNDDIIYDLAIDDIDLNKKSDIFTPLRDPIEEWTEFQIKNYYFDPKDILNDILMEKNEKLVEDLFKNIP